ncbi:MAG: acyl-CoA synthetase [Chloroflexi bacterium]|nr:acyl-CoA synthetase [Chloroflexota bacterium]
MPECEGLNTTASPGARRNLHPLDYTFHPRSIAVVGISADPPKTWIRRLYLDSFLQNKYPGQIYLVNPKGGEMAGLPIYRSVKDIPGQVDHVVISVPAHHTPRILKECLDIGVKVVHVFSSGYAETGEPDRIELQCKLVEIARQGDMRIIGPNCLGIYYPGGKIGLSPDLPMEPGPVGFLCQSGGNVTYTVRHAAARGLRFSKVVSYGNACDINECDLLNYFAADPETKVIAAYIEGAHDGRRLVSVLDKAAAAKPVVIFKGGFTPGGLRAAASHTGSLAGADVVWDGLLRQTGAIRVYDVEEMVDMLVALLCVKPPKGLNTCVVGHGGGASVMATDELERAGLRLVPIPPQIRERLKEFIDLANSMLRNPIDAGPMAGQEGYELIRIMGNRDPLDFLRERAAAGPTPLWGRLNALLKEWPGLDLVVYQHGFDISPMPVERLRVPGGPGSMVIAAKACELPKALVLHSFGSDNTWQASAELRAFCAELGLPLFLSMRGAATALRRLIDYNKAYPDRLSRLHAPTEV